MKAVFNYVLILLVLALIAVFLLWSIAKGSGHNIPASTTSIVIGTLITLGALIISVLFLRKRY
jgi:hypothetical protein